MSEKDGMIDSIKGCRKVKKNASDLTTIHRKDEVIVNFKKSSFSRMKDPVSRLKIKRQRVRGQVSLNVGGNDFFENFENEVEV